MIRPNRARIIGLAAARISRNAASRLIRMTFSNSSSFIRMRRLSRVIPALLTRMSSLPPSASTACGTSRSTAAPSERLQASATWQPPSSARKRSSFSALLPDSASCAPCTASAFAIALPRPPDEPVTSAVIPVRSNILCDLLRQRFDILNRDDAGDLRVGNDAFDHRTEHLAADLDEVVDARVGHVRHALAPPDHACNLLDEMVSNDVGIALRLRGHVSKDGYRRRLDDDMAQSIAHCLGRGLHQRA